MIKISVWATSLTILATSPLAMFAGPITTAQAGSCLNSGTSSASCSAVLGATNTIANASASIGGALFANVQADSGILTANTISSGGTATAKESDTVTFLAGALSGNGFVLVSPGLSGDFFYECSGNTPIAGGHCYFGGDVSASVTIGSTTMGNTLNAPDELSAGQSDTIPAQVFPAWLAPITFGTQYTVSYNLSVQAGLNCTQGSSCPIGGTSMALANFVDPPTFQVLDSNMNPVTGSTILSTDGIDYTGSTVPEPNLCLPLAVLLLGLIHRKRSSGFAGSQAALVQCVKSPYDQNIPMY
jgi:hypothetical protein